MSRADEAILAACAITRPGASVRTFRRRRYVVWNVERDALADPDVVVPRNQRWRSQVVSRIEGRDVFWSGDEHHGHTRTAVVQSAEAEIATE